MSIRNARLDRLETALLPHDDDVGALPTFEMNDFTLMARLCRIAHLEKPKAAGENREQVPAGPNGPVNPADAE